MTAWENGATGSGSIIAVIDSGIDLDSPEFANRIHPQSQDVAGNRSVEGEDDHGTNVSLVAAAARNGSGILGMAFDAEILALRADAPGSCATDTPDDPSLGCSFFDRDIARGIDVAINAGATVVNLSLGGQSPGTAVLDAVRRASAAGVVIVVSSGNYGDGSDPDFDQFQPTPFASDIRAAGGDNVIIVGSVDANGQFSDFANPAGDDSQFYLAARGERICCVYENGEIYIEQTPQGQFVILFSGTSFAAPQVAGAVALIRQAFPNLTGAEIVSLLFESARDGGAAGTDAIFGRGILDVAQAFRPAGAMSIPGTSVPLAVNQPTGIGSPAMGDALTSQGILAVVATDKYARAFAVDLGVGMKDARPDNDRLRAALAPGSRRHSAQQGPLTMAFSVTDRFSARGGVAEPRGLLLSKRETDTARLLAGRVIARLSPKLDFAFSVNEGAHGLSAQLAGAFEPAFLIAGSGASASAFQSRDQRAFAAGYDLAPGVRAVATFERGHVGFVGDTFLLDRQPELFDRLGFTRSGIEFSAQGLPIDSSISFDWMREDNTLLGGWFGGALGGSGSQSLSMTARFARSFANRWRLAGAWQSGWSFADEAGLVANSNGLTTSGWSVDLQRQGALGPADSVAFRLSQPLRVERGGLNLRVPTSYDYATETASFSNRRLSLTPTGRELVGELRWAGPVSFGWGGASLFYRHEPDHIADSPAEVGAAASFNARF
ncbi:S8 family peptidase [Qipengyuania aquimaris]|uniref:S8 family peptidase n=1 Tax=Qipengyuania aquimaris TaxID=255984 RepID=UPI002D7F1CE4|nr:S8 family peptidase [Qipengyuania aquimaris]